jgi:polyferredoxin
MFSFSPSQGLVEHILVDISWIMVGNYVKRKKKVMLDEKMGEVAKGERKKRKKKKKKKKEKRKELLCVLKILC